MLTLYRVGLSTNVERVALALAHKGLRVQSVVVPYEDRTEIRKVSGQDLVPVLVDDGKVVVDSMEIVRFNRVWKRPPNEMETELSKPEGQRDLKRVERLGRAMQGYLDLFEQMLTGRDHLLGEFSAADIAAFPFVKYATIHDPDDQHLFHKILVDYQRPGKDHPRVVGWIGRMDRRPRV